MNKLKTLVAAIVVALSALLPSVASAQSVGDMMNMLVSEFNKGAKEDPNVDSALWDGSNFVIVMSKDATSAITSAQVAEDQNAVKDYIILTVFGDNAQEKAEIAQLVEILNQVGVNFVVRAPLADGAYDVTLTTADLK